MPWSWPAKGRLPRNQLLNTILLLVGSAALAWLDPLTSLCSLPLLVGALALGRGRTWSVFLMLGGAAAAFTLASQGLLHWAACVPAGAALLAVVLITPALWRFDAPAFTLATACMTSLGVGAALGLIYSQTPEAMQLPEVELVYTPLDAGTPARSPAPPFAGQRIAPDRFTVRLSRLPQPGTLQLQITNHSGRPVVFVKRLDGSEWGWLQPTYELVAYDQQGERLPMGPRCGNYGGTYDSTTMRMVQHGETFTSQLHIPWFWLEHGAARLQVVYRFDPARVPNTAVDWADTPGMRQWLSRLFVGELASPTIALPTGSRVEPGPPTVWGSLDKAIIKRITDHHLRATAQCFDSIDDQQVQARVRYIIGASGRVVQATIEQAPKDPWHLRPCLLREIKTWRFPQCKCSAIVIVSQPFEARPAWD